MQRALDFASGALLLGVDWPRTLDELELLKRR
jgi:hypothetical protein